MIDIQETIDQFEIRKQYSPHIANALTILKLVRDNKLTPNVQAKWEINPDGYYPFCTHCLTEPESGLLTRYCPACGAEMLNHKN